MSSDHLGALVTPFVDGELVPARAAEARVHLAGCAECRRAVTAEQAARRRTQDSVRGMQASPELTARLLAMPTGPAPVGMPLDRARRAPFVVGGGAALVGLFVLTLFVLGTPRATQSPGSLLAATTEAPDAAVQPVTLSATAAELDDPLSATWAMPATMTIDRLDLVDQQGIRPSTCSSTPARARCGCWSGRAPSTRMRPRSAGRPPPWPATSSTASMAGTCWSPPRASSPSSARPMRRPSWSSPISRSPTAS